MKDQDVTNKEIYRIGDKVLKAVRLSDEEIDNIVATPQLFDSIRTAIRSERVIDTEPAIFGGLSFLHGFRWQTSAGVFGVLIVIAAGAVGLVNFMGLLNSSSDIVMDVPREAALPDTPHVSHSVPDPIEVPRTDPDVKKVVPQRGHATGRTVNIRYEKRQAVPKAEVYSEFFPITYAGDLEESKENDRLVRVDLPRASLFAMGIDIPAENNAERIKTDLLIGEDGVTKAIRLVN